MKAEEREQRIEDLRTMLRDVSKKVKKGETMQKDLYRLIKRIKEVQNSPKREEEEYKILEEEVDKNAFSFKGDEIIIDILNLESIEVFIATSPLRSPKENIPLPENSEDYDHDFEFKMNQRDLAQKMNDIYHMIDKVLDGKTTAFVRKCLQFMTYFGVFSSGFYLGSILIFQDDLALVDC